MSQSISLYNQLANHKLFSKSVNFGLKRIKLALGLLGHPEKKLKNVISVIGESGKFTTLFSLKSFYRFIFLVNFPSLLDSYSERFSYFSFESLLLFLSLEFPSNPPTSPTLFWCVIHCKMLKILPALSSSRLLMDCSFLDSSAWKSHHFLLCFFASKVIHWSSKWLRNK